MTGIRHQQLLNQDSYVKDLRFLREVLTEMEGKSIKQSEVVSVIEEKMQNGDIPSQFDLDSRQIERIDNAQGESKIGILAGAIRTQRFMHNYRSIFNGSLDIYWGV